MVQCNSRFLLDLRFLRVLHNTEYPMFFLVLIDKYRLRIGGFKLQIGVQLVGTNFSSFVFLLLWNRLLIKCGHVKEEDDSIFPTTFMVKDAIAIVLSSDAKPQRYDIMNGVVEVDEVKGEAATDDSAKEEEISE
ncbi:hypothetical protein Tco_0824197 [Tanacetum coccineum]|uniref:Uncharacterized protein n=1 Tax=Tanacetum coccineum TaxID=301880 RepID=A0ABQ5AP48_9ASTR